MRIGGEVGPLGIDHHHQPGPARQADRLRQHGIGQHSLGIVRNHHGIGALHGGGESGQHLPLDLRPHRRGDFLVQPQQLVRPAHEAGFQCGGPVRGAHQMALDAVRAVQDPADFLARVIRPGQADQHSLGAERGHVLRHIARAPRHATAPFGPQHGDRRLGRDPVHLAHDVAIQHDIAEHQHGAPGETRKIRRKGAVGDGGGWHAGSGSLIERDVI